MTLTIELPEALAEFVRAESLARHCSAGEAALELLGERHAGFDVGDLEASLAIPTPGERIPLTQEYIEELKDVSLISGTLGVALAIWLTQPGKDFSSPQLPLMFLLLRLKLQSKMQRIIDAK